MNKMKRILTIVLTLALIVTMMPMNLTNVNARTTTRLSSKKIVLQVGKTKKLKVKNKPAGVKVTWKSSKKKVATVSKKGKVKAKKAGKTTITAKVGKKKYKCRVIVRNKTNNVSQNVTKPANDNQNVTNKVTVTKPEGTTVRPITTTKPEGTTVRPITTTKPEGTTVRPTTTTKPEGTTVRPTTTTKPEGTTVRPTTTTKPEGTTVRPTTTTKPEGTTVRPTTTTKPEGTTVRPTEPNVDNDIQAPVGLIHAPGEGLPYHFAWAAVDGADGYNVYIDGVYVTKVTENVADLDASMFTKGAVEYTVGIATVKGDKISAITSVKYTYDGNGAQATTNVSVTTTVASVTTPSVPGQDVDESIKAPEGLVWAGNTDLPYYFAWAKADGIDSYNVYVDGTLVANVVDGSVNLNESVFTKGSGEYAIGIAAVKGNKTSAITSIKYTYAGSGQPATTKAPEVPTVAPTTVKPTTAKPTTKPKETTTIAFTTDSSIEKPFGLDVSQASVGYVNIVWGRGTIDCYNVYVDGERRRTGISAQSLKLPVYTEGTHTIAITTVVGTRESEKLEVQVAITGTGEKETEPETCPEELKPQLKKNVPLRDDRIAIELNNKTNGKYSDSEIYWCILGNNENNQLCYMDKDGNMIPASESLNTVEVNGTKYANIYHTLAESDHVYAPTIRSGRMYLSYGKPVYVKFNGSTGYAGPDLNNPGDVNANTLFEFAEFTIEGKNYWGNTTRVDYFCFPMVTRLIGGSLYGGYDNVVGDIGTRDEIFTAFKNEVPNEYKSLVRDDRIIAPCKSTFNVGQDNGNYFDNYINEFWNKYANEDLRFSSESGSFVGRVVGNQMRFTREGDSTVYYVDKPNTQEVLEGKGAFDRGNGVEKAIEAQLCAAFNRGVATEPDKWYTPSQYYKNSVANFYAGFFHEHSVLGKAYGFCYDDVNDQSTLLQYDKADALVIDLKW